MIISMKKRHSRNKGFTLIECIIAVAVFGLMALIVFMILTNASVRATRASKSEENLATLIENVVGDETYKKFDPTSKNLKLLIDNASDSSNDFLAVSYNVISGYKNFIECPDCGHQANFTEFMSSTAGVTGDPTSMTPIDSTAFDVATCYFVCPKNYETVSFTLCCPDCGAMDSYNKSSSSSASGYLFTYLKSASGGFECSVCGSTAVMAVDASGKFISEKASTDGFNVSGMVANGIRYGDAIDWTAHASETAELISIREVNAVDHTLPSTSHPTGGIAANLTYKGSMNSSFVGEYELNLQVDPSNLPSEIGMTDPYFIEVAFPIGYTPIYDEATYTEVKTGTKTIGTKTYPTILISKTGVGSLSRPIKFKLISNGSGYSFEYDYNRQSSETDKEQGLFRWFDFGSVTSVTRSGEGYLVQATGSGTIAD